MQPLPPPPVIPPRPENELSDAMYDIAEALHYPVDSQGRVYDVRYMLPVLSYHLARAGCRVDPQRAIVKPRRLPPTPGVVEDAVEWVPVGAPDSVYDELAGATVDDLDRLSPAARAEVIRRLGGEAPPVEPELDERAGWHVQTHIHFDDEEP